jgi:hypothetical protein
MKRTYETIHTYKDKQWYGRSYLNADEVLKLREEEHDNILDDL